MDRNLGERAGCWLLHSGIQEPLGGFARYYRSDLKQNAGVSTEITGYAAGALVYLHARTGEDHYLEPALRAGRFLTRTAWDNSLGTIPFEVAAAGQQAYFFDLGIIARGLLALWRARREPEFLATAHACAAAMAEDFAAGGEFHPVLLLPSKRPAPREPRWSREPGCYQLKAALAWYELAEEGQGDFRAAYDCVLAFALREHSAFLDGEPDRDRLVDRLHAYCYFLEGLLPCADRPDCALTLQQGIARVARLSRELAPDFERCDVYAQLLRLRLFADRLGAAPLDRPSADYEAAVLPTFQAGGMDEAVRGGFHFGRRRGEPLPYINPVSTFFSLQALQMWSEYNSGGFEPDWRLLI